MRPAGGPPLRRLAGSAPSFNWIGRMNTVCGKGWAYITTTSAVLVGAVAALSIGVAGARTPRGAAYFPNGPPSTQDGATVRFYGDLLEGQTVAVNLIYT